MAKPKTLQGQKLLVQLGDDATPTEAFTAVCGINEATVEFSASVQEANVHDCATPDDPAWVERDVDGLSCMISGAGLADTGTFESVLFVWWSSGDPKNIRFKLDTTLANGGGYFSGSFVCTKLSLTGTRKQRSTFDIEMMSNGAVTWTDASA
jgi:predicted secreted protein